MIILSLKMILSLFKKTTTKLIRVINTGKGLIKPLKKATA
jgi:hypothetical protein